MNNIQYEPQTNMISIYQSQDPYVYSETANSNLKLEEMPSATSSTSTSTATTTVSGSWADDAKYQFGQETPTISVVEQPINETVAAPTQPTVQSTVNQEMLQQLLADTDHYHLNGSTVQKDITADSKRHECTAGPRTFYERIGVHLEFWGNNASTATEAAFTKDPNWELVYASDYGPSVNQWGGVQPGDICVQFAYDKNGKSTSHGCMFNGQQWVSDFKQRNCWVYESTSSRKVPKGAVQVWRYKPLYNQTVSNRQGGILTWASSPKYSSYEAFTGISKFADGGDFQIYQSQEYSPYIKTLNEDYSLDKMSVVPEQSQDGTVVASTATSWADDPKYSFGQVPVVDATTQASPTTESSVTVVTPITTSVVSKTITPKGPNAARDRMIQAIMSYGVDEVTATALAVQTGGESNYNPKLDSGIGGWIPSTRGKVIDAINDHFGTNYPRNSFKTIPLEQQIWALVNRYYLPYKDKVDAIDGLYGKAEAFAKIGFGPAIFSQGSWTDKKGLTSKTKGKTYRDTPEDWYRYIVDTGNVTWGTTNWDDHFAHRVQAHGWNLA